MTRSILFEHWSDMGEDLGAVIRADGCAFRVWAPNPVAVSVLLQDGAQWEALAPTVELPLLRDGDYWSTTAPGVAAGRLYRFRLALADGTELIRLDPAARDVLSSELTRNDPDDHNAGIVCAPDDSGRAPFATPWFEDFLIYQLHVGTFAGRGDQFGLEWAGFEQVETKLGYIRELGFSCVELLPVHEYAMDRSWGYNPASLFAVESSYGSPQDLRRFVDAAHRHGLAVIFDVVYNHMGGDNVLWEYDGRSTPEGGIYFEGGQMTSWGRGPAWWKGDVQELYYQNARMYLSEYGADGLRFDATTQINGIDLAVAVGRLRTEFPSAYLIAEHLPDNPWIVEQGRFCATWCSRAHQETQRALAGIDQLAKVGSLLDIDGYRQPWNLVTYLLGSHDDIGDLEHGDAEHGLSNWDSRHRYLVDLLGGRDDPAARARCRLAWALNVAAPGTPMLFMGSECHMGAPYVGWGYWTDNADEHGDHRFDWSIAGDPVGIPMRRLVAAANAARWGNPALRTGNTTVTHRDPDNQVLGFVRESGEGTVLAVVNLGERDFGSGSYGVDTGGRNGSWTQVLCTQDAAFGGWDGAGNAYARPSTQPDGRVYLNLPPTSVILLRRDAF